MTLYEYKKYASGMLSEISENPVFEAEQIMTWALELSENDLILKKYEQISPDNEKKLGEALTRRVSREPLQYIIGEWDFMGLRMFCGRGCLVPRPETELLAALAERSLPKGGRFIDLCTGSGCIAVSILKMRPDVTAVAVDKSDDALKYAIKNADYHGVSDRLEIISADIAEFTPAGKADVIVSNPPYIKTADIESLMPEVRKEPYMALDGGCDGLDFYRIIAKRYRDYISQSGVILTEIGYDIAKGVSDVFEKAGFNALIIKDDCGNDRVCKAVIKAGTY